MPGVTLPGFVCHLTQVPLNTDTSLISVIISKTEKADSPLTKVSVDFGKIRTASDQVGGYDFVDLSS